VSGDFQIGDWIIQPSVNRLRRGEQVVRLEPKVMQVLVCLAEKAGEVVSREDLIARVWPDVFVTDDVLHRAIRELRRIFGDSSSHPRYIETIRKRGYRLIIPTAAASLEADMTAGSIPIDKSPSAGGAPAPAEDTAPRPAIASRARWPFSFLAAGVGLTIAAAVLMLATRSSELAPQAHARFVPVVSGPLNESDPAVSPDGRQVAFVQREAGDHASADIYIRDLLDGQTTRVTEDAASDRMPAWSPDGARLAFVRVTAKSCDIMIRTLDSHAERHVAPCGNPSELKLAWTADGVALLLAQRTSWYTASRIARLALDTGAMTPLTAPPSSVAGDDSPAVSPDGRRVAFIRRVSGGVADVHVVGSDGTGMRRVTFDEADLTGVDWSADGRFVVYSSDRAGGYSLWRVPAEGGTPVLMAGGAARMKHPVTDRAGRRVVYENWNYEINVWEVGLVGQVGQVGRVGQVERVGVGPDRPVTRTSELWNLYPQVSPDGARVAYVSTQSGAHELWVADRDGGGARQLTRIGRGVVRMPRWSPDGRRITYLARGQGGVDVQGIDVATGEVSVLTTSPASEVAPAWSHDGTRVLFGVPDPTGQWNVWSVAASGTERALSLVIPNAVAAQPSADGQWYYFTRPDRTGLWRAPAHNPEGATRVTDAVAAGNTIGWTVTAGGVYFVDEHDDEVRLMMAPLAGGREVEVATLSQFSWPGFSVTPDGAHALYARWERRDSNLMSLQY
jgi:Tol biopolymer transport system component/DNA-binding winged helix-turn-helix (wHTH) protein